MRHLFLAGLVILQVLLADSTLAQSPTRAVTDAGQRVLLFPDGSWKPDVSKPPRASPVGKSPKPGRITLLARAKYKDYEKATFSFEHGVRDDPKLELTLNDWDLEYGNGGDALGVTMVTDDRSRIKDLGAMRWSDIRKIPELPAHPVPTREPVVPAVVGHMYLVHTRDSNSDFYALFRVEELVHGDSCTITWKIVPNPEPDSAPNKALQLTPR
jgi:hypothetical protein